MTFVLPKPVYLPQPRIERIVEEHLSMSGLLPSRSAPVVDIEAFLEDYLRVRLDQHADLPPNELGVTHFQRDKVPLVQINRDLTDLADDGDSPFWARARWRSTLAHEGAHVILHREEYEGEPQTSLFLEEEPPCEGPRLHRCLKRDFGSVAARLDPREYQANAGMAALLMPRPSFVAIATSLLQEIPAIEGDGAFEKAIRSLATRFHVSCQAARIRVRTLDLPAWSRQTTLGF